jgi:hypothetical protein
MKQSHGDELFARLAAEPRWMMCHFEEMGLKLKGSSAMASKEEGYLKGRERRDARARLHSGGLHDGHDICRLNRSASNVAAGTGVSLAPI